MGNLDLRATLKGIPGVVTALNAMCDGLEYQDSRKDFRIYMNTFGTAAFNGDCVGCAATCALQEMTGIDFDIDSIISEEARSYKTGIIINDLNGFEAAIDCARMGNLTSLYMFCNEPFIFTSHLWHLETSNWKEKLPTVRKYIKTLMKDNGLEWGFEEF